MAEEAGWTVFPDGRENLFTHVQDLFAVFLSTNVVMWCPACLSLRTLFFVRTHAACLMVHGNIGESGVHVERRDVVFGDFQ